MAPIDVAERQKRVLWAVVEEFVHKSQPVGSKTVERAMDNIVSPATIRREMSELENLGYLTHLHTSSGRIPTPLGYRFYAQSLTDTADIEPYKKEIIFKKLSNVKMEIEQALSLCVKLLSEITQYTSVIYVPDFDQGKIQRVELVPMGSGQILVILILTTGLVYKKNVKIDERLSSEMLSNIGRILNEHFYGLTLRQVWSVSLSRVEQEIAHLTRLFKREVEELLKQLINPETTEKMYVEGLPKILSEPEFQGNERARGLLEALDEGTNLSRMLKDCASPFTGEIKVLIGEEISNTIKDLGMVVTSCSTGYGKSCFVAVFGPMRMRYKQTIGSVKFLSGQLSELLRKTNIYGRTANTTF